MNFWRWQRSTVRNLSFFSRVISVFMERVTQLLERTPEFQRLSREHQSVLLHDNRNRAAALTLAKLDSFKDGNEQLRFALGHFDDQVYSQDYACVLPNKKLKRFSLFDDIDNCPDRNSCLKIICQINSLVTDMGCYKLLLLLLLFKTDQFRDSDLDNLAARYTDILEEKFCQTCGSKAKAREHVHSIQSKVQNLADNIFSDAFSRRSRI